MEFGKIKTGVEALLIKNYSTKKFTETLKEFKEDFLKNKDISKIYNIYNIVDKKRGLKKEHATEYLDIIKENFNSLVSNNKKDLKRLYEKYSTNENEYQEIDNFLNTSSDLDSIVSMLESRDVLINKLVLVEEDKPTTTIVNLPLSYIKKIVDNKKNSILENLDEKTKKTINELYSYDVKEIEEKVSEYKQLLNNKLTPLIESENKETIEKVIEKVKNTDKTIEGLIDLKVLFEDL